MPWTGQITDFTEHVRATLDALQSNLSTMGETVWFKLKTRGLNGFI